MNNNTNYTDYLLEHVCNELTHKTFNIGKYNLYVGTFDIYGNREPNTLYIKNIEFIHFENFKCLYVPFIYQDINIKMVKWLHNE